MLNKTFILRLLVSTFLAVVGSVSLVHAAPQADSTLATDVQAASNQSNINTPNTTLLGAEAGKITAQLGKIQTASGEKIVVTFTRAQNLSSIVVSSGTISALVQRKLAVIDESNITLSAEGFHAVVSSIIKEKSTAIPDQDQVAKVDGHILIQGDEENVALASSSSPAALIMTARATEVARKPIRSIIQVRK